MRLAELEVPALPEFVAVARLVASSIADDRYELTNDRLDNLKLAVSEACSMAIEFNGAAGSNITVAFDGSDSGLEVVVHGHGGDFTQVRPAHEGLELEGRELETELGLPFIESLVDELVVERSETGNRLRMTLHCEPAEQL